MNRVHWAAAAVTVLVRAHQRHLPLVGMLWIFPGRPHGIDIALGRLAERRHSPALARRILGIYPGGEIRARVGGQFPSFLERHVACGPEANFCFLAAPAIQENPPSATVLGNGKIEPAPIGMALEFR
jgi:hypothetical protein